jgi:acyl-CoA dehydrogenase
MKELRESEHTQADNDFPQACAWANPPTLRLADGPDEVHRNAVARLELNRYRETQTAR